MKNKKYLVVFGIFALVIVTTAASFAFFTYSRVGNTTTTITSGDIEFTYEEGDDASFANAFPVSDKVGAQDTSEEYTFTVNMKSSSTANKMNYNVYLIDANDQENTNYFNNEQIKFALVKNGTYVAGTSSTSGKKLSDINGFNQGTSEGEGLVLEDQEILANTTDEYKLRIWISDDVKYSNTETTGDGTDENNDTQTSTGKYNGYKYSLKVKVTSDMTSPIGIKLNSLGRVIVADLEDSNGLSSYAVTQSETIPEETSDEWINITSEDDGTSGTAKSNVVRTTNEKITNKKIQHKVNSYGTYYVHVKNNLNQTNNKIVKVEIDSILKDTSGAAEPVIKGDLVPVIMNGSDVIKADTSKGWYNYDQGIWANAVILTDNAPTYNNGDLIKEEHIESYFVWIPRYEYKIFDENAGNYTTFSSKGTKKKEIEIQFVTKNDAVKNGSSYGTWLTHPAFTAFDTNGIWVGKFESGYKGATTTLEAEQNVNDSSKLIIKPNVYSWRGIQVANAHLVSYNYNRELDSHMMKNTEWGAVAYLSHSKYGAKDEKGNVGISLRINNNNASITGYSATVEPTLGHNEGTAISGNMNESVLPGNDGKYTINYLNTDSVKSSTTENYSGIYDMSGGAFEYVMGVMLDSSGIPLSGDHNVWNSGFKGKYGCPTCASSVSGGNSSITANTTGVPLPTDSKYYDTYKYSSNVYSYKVYNTRILGDATGEIGPFYQEIDPSGITKFKSYWYEDLSYFVFLYAPWFARSMDWSFGNGAGIFSFSHYYGSAEKTYGFRTVLIP